MLAVSTMDPRGVAEELCRWYQSELDPFQTHSQNVRNLLHGPVLNLTSRVLQQDTVEQECHGLLKEEETKVNNNPRTGNADNSPANIFSVGKIISEAPSKQSKQEDDLYFSLGRRSRARLDAFLKGVEISVASAAKRSPLPSPSLNPRSQKNVNSLGVPKTLSSVGGATAAHDAEGNPQSPGRTSHPQGHSKKHIASSPVLNSLNRPQ